MVDLGRKLIRGDTVGRGELRELKAAAPSPEATSIPKQQPVILRGFSFIIDGGGRVITTGEKGHVTIPFGATIIKVELLADQSGSIVVDIWKDTYANFPPTSADSITASAKPTLSTAIKYTDSTLSGWQKGLIKGDILSFNVDSITNCERVTVTLTLAQTVSV